MVSNSDPLTKTKMWAKAHVDGPESLHALVKDLFDTSKSRKVGFDKGEEAFW